MTFSQAYELYKNTWQGFIDVEEVAYTDSDGDQEAVKARQIEPDQKELELIDGLASLQSDYITFNLWNVSLGGKVPGGGGVITQADGTKWTVQSVKKAQWGAQHRCLCIKQVT
ncbi:hypothetical protein [Blastopirellula retiformator]|uniref:Uncharacterized protein n=1 Tax=Blastopirellula retiformator TaxID=2527970 RepID=A0A5C5UWF9_9BACT|nr:hypothetical protein [Blastopirellula retiformator]TWT30714.1 hypothetical protein Enr8_42370 [Blastopirellula retiformator]